MAFLRNCDACEHVEVSFSGMNRSEPMGPFAQTWRNGSSSEMSPASPAPRAILRPQARHFSTSPASITPSEEQSLVRRGPRGHPALALVSSWLPKPPGPQPARHCHQIRKPPPFILLPLVPWGISIFAFSLACTQNLRPKRATARGRAGGREGYLGEDGDVPIRSPPLTLEK